MNNYLRETLINLTIEYKLRIEFAREEDFTFLFQEYVDDFMYLTNIKKEWWDYRLDESGHSKRLSRFLEKIAPF